MQEHVELEVSLEIIMARIAEKIFEINNQNNEEKKKILEQELKNLMDIQEEAYKANRKTIKGILNI